MYFVIVILLVFTLLINNAYAYVGPGLGLGVIGVFVGMVVVVFLAIVGAIWYPLKRMLGKSKTAKAHKRDNSGREKSNE